jgi:hypothetical protein
VLHSIIEAEPYPPDEHGPTTARAHQSKRTRLLGEALVAAVTKPLDLFYWMGGYR